MPNELSVVLIDPKTQSFPEEEDYQLEVEWEDSLPDPGHRYGTQKTYLSKIRDGEFKLDVVSNIISPPGDSIKLQIEVAAGKQSVFAYIEKPGKYLVNLFRFYIDECIACGNCGCSTGEKKEVDWEKHMLNADIYATKEIEIGKTEDGLEILENK